MRTIIRRSNCNGQELDYDFRFPLLFLGFGLSDFMARIPMRGEITSLNASVAAALVMYEAFKQRSR
ncbi:MAG: hypothetical protein D4S01_03740 [Dehalococcoidia bacterium]|nr:MAG: hypothetical protein D4S01_03740 [Dehalococcoidia bacterium]